ncbi:MAG: acyl-CoA reductase [Bacteroidota bacterium]|nr:acyl-CoA reductase [Bacteroidota bacterium]
MNLKIRIEAFVQLINFMNATANKNESEIDSFLVDDYKQMLEIIEDSKIINSWFSEEMIISQLLALSMVATREKIESWIMPYSDKISLQKSKRIGVVMAGNIPLVGFHDFLSVLITGNVFVGKLSSKDDKLPVKIAEVLIKIEPEFENVIEFTNDRLKNFDAIIATGSNNTARYFEYYFDKYPNIIRKSRNSLAIITGDETKDELQGFADDILLYFGLGCRNISKVFVPKSYKFDTLFEALYKYKDLINHNKYVNNFDYNRAIYLLNSDEFLENGFFMIKKDNNLASPVAVLHYEYYDDIKEIENFVNINRNRIQCIVSKQKINNFEILNFGQSQFPELFDYEDEINTINFLTNI